jgi:hypothetical protein
MLTNRWAGHESCFFRFLRLIYRAFILPMRPAGHLRLEIEDRKDWKDLNYRDPLREIGLFVIPFSRL